mmetsp:Transcript_8886/g.23027  ORF Transcript_8886/g.23027 Transcript_8886/m.23027 type:complete len:335 (+) Transcript_8886:109-1113(+)
MGRKKGPDATGVKGTAQESFELRPFCYYCDREFDTTKTLIQHQRTKHFNCTECGLKFDTITGLRVHMLNAYKRTMKEVPNAVPGRENPDIVVHGMEGLPKSILEERTRKAMSEQAERQREKAERAAARAAERPADPPPPSKDFEEVPVAPPPPDPAPPPAPAPPEPAAPPPAPQAPQSVAPSALSSLPPPPRHAAAPRVAAASGGSCASSGGTAAPAARAAPGALPNLSPSVAKLLHGNGSDGAAHMTSVPGRPDIPVPKALSGLHPVALQMLAAANALQRDPAATRAPAPQPAPVPQSGVLLGHIGMGSLGAMRTLGGPGVEPDEKRPRLLVS